MSPPADARAVGRSRWVLVAVAAACMGMAGTYQFVWSSVRGPLGARVGADAATVGSLFTLLIVSQTLAQFPAGRLRDRRGPLVPLLVAAAGIGAGYAGLALARSPAGAAAAVVVGGAGAGAAYTVAVNTPVKWFDRRRGLATGAVSMGYGGLSFLLIPVVRGGAGGGVVGSLWTLAVLGALACLVGATVVRDPDGGEGSGGETETGPAATWRDAARTWQFWVLYVAFVAVNGVGLMLIGSVVALADGLGLPAAAATAAASAVAIADSAGILAVSAVSDRVGRERTAGASLVASGLAVAGTVLAGVGRPAVFVALAGAAAFFRSPVFAIFPSLVGEYYGTAHASETYASLYTAKLWGAVVGGTLTSLLVARAGWTATFALGGGLLVCAGVATALVRPVDPPTAGQT